MRYLGFVMLLAWALYGDYLTNESCKECHEKIYEEYSRSQHAKSYFTDELHRKIADAADRSKYGCAPCHMPSADNMPDLLSGKARPDRNNPTHTDGVSCYFCHTLAYVKKAHRYNINIKSRQAEGYKPTFYGRLDNPDSSDKHSSVANPLYAKNVCLGCHAHKLNDNNVTIFRAMADDQDSLECIECHMPQTEGGAEKMDKRTRGHHASHRFLGIHDADFRRQGVDINISAAGEVLQIGLRNRMAHPLIIQPARAKFLKVTLIRDGQPLWQNYRKRPEEDRQGYFGYSFSRNGKPIIIPATATAGRVHNLDAKSQLLIRYRIPEVHKGDEIEVGLWVQLAKSACADAITLKNSLLTTPSLIKSVNYTVGE